MDQSIGSIINDFAGRELAKKNGEKYNGPDISQCVSQVSDYMLNNGQEFLGPYQHGHRKIYLVNKVKQKKQDPLDSDFLIYVIRCWAQHYNCQLPETVIKEFPAFFCQHLDTVTDRRYDKVYLVCCSYKRPIPPVC